MRARSKFNVRVIHYRMSTCIPVIDMMLMLLIGITIRTTTMHTRKLAVLNNTSNSHMPTEVISNNQSDMVHAKSRHAHEHTSASVHTRIKPTHNDTRDNPCIFRRSLHTQSACCLKHGVIRDYNYCRNNCTHFCALSYLKHVCA